MKKTRNIIILLLAALMLTIFVSCDDSQKEPPVDYTYASFEKAWVASGNAPAKMPKEPAYAKMNEAELKAFNDAADSKASAAIADSVFKVTFSNKDVLEQKADGSWAFTKYVEPEPPVDYTYATFEKAWTAAGNDVSKMPKAPIYSKMNEAELKAFNDAAADSKASAAIADSVFKVTFSNKDVLEQKADGSWAFTKYVEPEPPVDYTYATFEKAWTAAGNDVSKMPKAPIYSKMNEAELKAFNDAAISKASAVIADSVFKVTFQNKDILEQKADGTWTFTIKLQYDTPAAVDALASDLKASMDGLFAAEDEFVQTIKETVYFSENGIERTYIDTTFSSSTSEDYTYTYILGENTVTVDSDDIHRLNGEIKPETDETVQEILDAFSDLHSNITKVIREVTSSTDSISFTNYEEIIGSEDPSATQTITAKVKNGEKEYSCVFTPTRNWNELLALFNPEAEMIDDALILKVDEETIDMNMPGLATDTKRSLMKTAAMVFGMLNGK